MNYIVTAAQVRDYLELNSPGSTSRYSDQTINSNIRAAQAFLEHECHRYFYDHPAVTWAKTTMLQAQVDLPGFRTLTTVTWGGTTMSVAVPGDGNTSPSAWGLWEASPGIPDNGRLVVGLQFRPWRVDNDRAWWYADSGWFDKALDSPFYPGNWGGGYAWTSMPNDLIIVGDGGYAPGSEPDAVMQAIKVLSSWYTMRPASVMATMTTATTGQALTYTELPPEVARFIADWKLGSQVQSVG